MTEIPTITGAVFTPGYATFTHWDHALWYAHGQSTEHGHRTRVTRDGDRWAVTRVPRQAKGA